MAKLHFKYGAMNSGKSDTLIKTAYNYKERGLKILVIKPNADTKSVNTIIARGGAECTVDILAEPATDLLNEIRKHTDIACILVDEAQFLTEKQISELYQIAKKDNVSVICFGLRADFQTEMFPGKHLFGIQ
jgi:thymidine kinase